MSYGLGIVSVFMVWGFVSEQKRLCISLNCLKHHTSRSHSLDSVEGCETLVRQDSTAWFKEVPDKRRLSGTKLLLLTSDLAQERVVFLT